MCHIKDSLSIGRSTVSPLPPSWLGKAWFYAWFMRVLTAFILGHAHEQLYPLPDTETGGMIPCIGA